MAVLSDEQVAALTRRLVETVIDYKRETERLRAALEEIAFCEPMAPWSVARAALADNGPPAP